MKLLVSLALLHLIGHSYGQQGIESVECPFPGGSSANSQVNCGLYPACTWSGTTCHMNADTVAGYSVASAPVDTGRGFKVNLNKIDPTATLFNQDINDLVLEVINHEDHHVQVKIYDPLITRYEIPFPLSAPAQPGLTPLYNVQVSGVGTPLTLSVVRTATQTNVFELFGPLTFEDQFLQFTTRLPSSYVYGFGENAHTRFRHSFGSRITTPLFARDQPVGFDEFNQYGVQPYYVNIEDNSGNTHSVLFYNSNAMEYSTFSLSDGTPMITMRSIGGIIDLHFFLGPYPEDVNVQYATSIGKASFPPYWALGFHLSRYGYNSVANLQTIRDRMKAAGIPQDVQTCDIDYMHLNRDFTYDTTNWAGFPQFIDDLHAEGVKLTLILDPALIIDFVNYPPSVNGKAQDVFVKWMDSSLVPADQEIDAQDYMVGYVWPDMKTVFPDFLNPVTAAWWSGEFQTLHQTLPFDAIWIDMNEPANFGTNMNRPFNYPTALPDWSLKCPFNKYDSPPFPTKATYQGVNECQRISDKTLCMSGLHSNGSAAFLHYDVHSLYGLTQSMATEQAMASVFPGKRHLILARATFPGSGSYVAHWLGDNNADWEQMRKSIVGMLEFNLFGIPNVGADVCGFFNEPTEELCARWMQLGAFYPFDRNHNTIGTPDQDPARPDWPIVNSVSRDVLLLRYKYLPYLYFLFMRASGHGDSVIRPLFNLFPNDVNARDIDDQFFWGDGLMIAPVVYEGGTNRDVYFPEGLYYDLVVGSLTATGPTTLNIAAPIDKIPVYVRGGSILPNQEPDVTTALSRLNPFGLTVALDESGLASGSVYWDDGEIIHSNNTSYMASVTYGGSILNSTIKHGEAFVAGLNFEVIQFYGYPSNPSSITVNGVPQSTSAWIYSGTSQVLTLTTSAPLSQALLVELV